MVKTPYLFPIYDMILPGQLKQLPEIRDINRDSYLDILYETTAEKGVLYYDAKQQKVIRADRDSLIEKEKKLTIEQEMKIFDNGT